MIRQLLAATLIAVAAPPAGADAIERARLLAEIDAMARATAALTGIAAIDAKVMAALAAVPRDAFVPETVRAHAWENRPLPIGHQQTISQPYIVALMTDLLEVEPGDRVFEVGTGSGYQAAVLAELGVEVYSIEIVPALAERAAGTLARLGYRGVHVRAGDGYHGWPEHAPFDAIVVTAGATHVPEPLVDQLAPGGVLVIPVGRGALEQDLVVLTKHADGRVETRAVLPVRFVPLTGGH